MSQLCEMTRKKSEAQMPVATALLAAFLPSHSDRMSVIRNVTANNILPRVISIPYACIRIRTSMLARIVAAADKT